MYLIVGLVCDVGDAGVTMGCMNVDSVDTVDVDSCRSRCIGKGCKVGKGGEGGGGNGSVASVLSCAVSDDCVRE